MTKKVIQLNKSNSLLKSISSSNASIFNKKRRSNNLDFQMFMLMSLTAALQSCGNKELNNTDTSSSNASDESLAKAAVVKSSESDIYTAKGYEDEDIDISTTDEYKDITPEEMKKIDLKDENGKTPLMQAALKGDKEAVKKLIAKKVDIDITDKTEKTALSQALYSYYSKVSNNDVNKNLIEALQVLIKDSENPASKNAVLKSLSSLTNENNIEIIKMLIKAGARLDVKVQDKLERAGELLVKEGLHEAELERHPQAITLYLYMANKEYSTEKSALGEKYIQKAESILEKLNTSNKENIKKIYYEKTALEYAFEGLDKTAIIQKLLKNTDVNLKYKEGNTALILAATRVNVGIVKELIKANANLNLQNDSGETALLAALKSYMNKDNTDVIAQDLIKAGADLNLKDNNGQTALMLAADRFCEAVTKDLIKAGADLNLKDNDNKTALMFAAFSGNDVIVKALIEAEANLNLKDNHGKTALMLAAERGHEAVVKELIAANADLTPQDNDSKTALMYAIYWGGDEGGNILEKLIYKDESHKERTKADIEIYFWGDAEKTQKKTALSEALYKNLYTKVYKNILDKGIEILIEAGASLDVCVEGSTVKAGELIVSTVKAGEFISQPSCYDKQLYKHPQAATLYLLIAANQWNDTEKKKYIEKAQDIAKQKDYVCKDYDGKSYQELLKKFTSEELLVDVKPYYSIEEEMIKKEGQNSDLNEHNDESGGSSVQGETKVQLGDMI